MVNEMFSQVPLYNALKVTLLGLLDGGGKTVGHYQVAVVQHI